MFCQASIRIKMSPPSVHSHINSISVVNKNRLTGFLLCVSCTLLIKDKKLKE